MYVEVGSYFSPETKKNELLLQLQLLSLVHLSARRQRWTSEKIEQESEERHIRSCFCPTLGLVAPRPDAPAAVVVH